MKKQLVCYPTRLGNMVHDQRDKCIGWSFKEYGEWAPGELAILNKVINPGDTVIDVGANVGYHSLFFSLKVQPSGNVIAFEPHEINHKLLTLNCIINNLENTKIHKALIGSKTEIVMLEDDVTDIQNLAAASFAGHMEKTESGSPYMKLKLDDLNLENCNLIKIDVEGMELEVISGAQDIIAEKKPIVFYEQNTVANFHEIQKILSDRDYASFWSVSKAYPKFNIRRNEIDIFKGNTETNILAIHKDQVSQHPWTDTLTQVTDDIYSPPELSALGEEDMIKASLISQVDVQWANFLSSYFQN
ncbi:FkbM family methyltransferase [Kordiimonas sp. SCSIO 12603]|uniref:FkbM family methyltransferase n=1 Tax=Kordiimonas sp. SCSIO 12603 TaxID=2829596 RepID=UPI002102038C|nr:FkbM family methyltransferase [Kordiimonas sp. SCSIO 12603]UTW59681.1 FkbM family methyltransferase [Kordiimonas sp. SCSIO 12603]